MSRIRRSQGLCASPDCSYRRLYEGSQASLSDMAGKQAGALNRVARLRDGLVRALKQNFPVGFADAEAQMGARMSSTEDEVLLAYLFGFLASAQSGTAVGASQAVSLSRGQVDELRAALVSAGVALPDGHDLSAWAAALRQHAQSAPSAPADSALPAVALVEGAPARPEPAVSDDEAAAGLSDPAPARRRTGTGGLAPMAEKAQRPSARRRGRGQGSAAVEASPDQGDAPTIDPFDDLPPDLDASSWADLGWEDDESLSGLPSAPAEGTPPASDGEQPPAESAALKGLFDDEAETTPAAATDDLFTDSSLRNLFEDLEHLDDPQSLVDALFNEAPSADPVPGADLTAEPAAPPAADRPVDQGLGRGTRGGAGDVPTVADPSATTEAARAVEEPTPTVSAPAPADDAGADPQASDSPVIVDDRSSRSAMRPQLFPAASVPRQAKTARRGRTARVSAAPPDPKGLDVPLTESSSDLTLTDELFNQMVSAVVIPRPVFTSDLAAMAGADVASAWEQRCRDMGTDGPLRFITAKPRHKARGSLVVPHSPELRAAAAEFTRSSWAACLDDRRLRGAKLYEVAVLLHRFGDSVLSNRVEDALISLRVTQPRGLVGVVMSLEPDLSAGSEGRKALADAVEQLLADRLTLVAALTYQGQKDAVHAMADALREEGAERRWEPLMPVIASTSWDFAADGGSSALSVL